MNQSVQKFTSPGCLSSHWKSSSFPSPSNMYMSCSVFQMWVTMSWRIPWDRSSKQQPMKKKKLTALTISFYSMNAARNLECLGAEAPPWVLIIETFNPFNGQFIDLLWTPHSWQQTRLQALLELLVVLFDLVDVMLLWWIRARFLSRILFLCVDVEMKIVWNIMAYVQ